MAPAHTRRGDERRLLSDLLARVPLPLVVGDRETGAIVDANAAFLDLLGTTWEAVVGESAETLGLHAGVDQRRAIYAELTRDGSVASKPVSIRVRGGEIRSMSMSVKTFELEGNTYSLTTLVDTTEERRAHAMLVESELRFRGAFDAAATGMALVHPNGRFARVNRSLCRILGYDEAALLAITYKTITHPDDIDIEIENVRRMLANELDYFELEKRYVHQNGHVIWVVVSVSLVRDDDAKPLYFVAQVQDITDRKRMEDALRASERAVQVELAARQESERRFRAIFDHTFQFTGLLSPDGSVLEINKTTLAFGGLTRAEVIGRPIWEARWWAPGTVERIREAVIRAARGEFVRFEVEVRGSAERARVIDFSLKALHDADGNVAMLIPEGHDVTEIKRTEQRLESSLEEKEILLKEIHHRVKNNMQVVSSLLQLQSRYTKDEDALAMFRESQDRIRSMALIHEKLYKTKDLSRVDFADYLHTLGDMMSRSYGGTRAGIRIDIEADPAWLGVDTAIPVGLILNELVTNAMKHAFDETSIGRIAITFRGKDDGRFSLEVEDDGDGLPGTFSLEAETSLGLRLLRILTGQVEGELTFIARPRGTHFRLAFADVSAKGAASR